jgi:hypothetical protein
MMAHPEIAGYQLPKLINFFGPMTVSEITPGICRAYVERRQAEPNSRYKIATDAPRVSLSTIRRELVTLQAAIRYAWKEGMVTHPIAVEKPDEPRAASAG